jgi:hypothetical protein
MPADPQTPSQRLRRSLWATAAFLIGFAVLIGAVVYYYLLPAADAARSADAGGRRQLSAFSMLLLAVVLLCLWVGLFMAFRVRRFFFPRPVPPRTKTDHVDAWTESGRRLELNEAPDEPR